MVKHHPCKVGFPVRSEVGPLLIFVGSSILFGSFVIFIYKRIYIMIDLSKCKSLNDVAKQEFGKANYTNRKKVKELLKNEGVDWKEWIESKKIKPRKFCLYCGKEITGKRTDTKKFCNSSCAAKYNNAQRKHTEETKDKISHTLQERNSNFTGEYKARKEKTKKLEDKTLIKEEKRYCLFCGKELKDKRKKIYCSRQCQEKQYQKEYIERWKNGEENGLSGDYNLSKRIRKYLLEKHHYSCEKCGWGEINEYTKNYPLEIHHIDGDYTNNKEENLQVLCPNCHSLTENFKAHNKNGRKNREKYY